jgi:hypothetical protein
MAPRVLERIRAVRDNAELDRLQHDSYPGNPRDAAFCGLAVWRIQERSRAGLTPLLPGDRPGIGNEGQPSRDSYVVLWLLGAFLAGLILLIASIVWGIRW